MYIYKSIYIYVSTYIYLSYIHIYLKYIHIHTERTFTNIQLKNECKREIVVAIYLLILHITQNIENGRFTDGHESRGIS